MMKKNRIWIVILIVLIIGGCGIGIGTVLFRKEVPKQNPDEYAWISIQGTRIDGPVLQNAEDSTFYASHNEQGEEDSKGTFYTDSYNSRTFDDPITVVYGNNNADGSMFGELYKYADSQYMTEHSEIQIIMDDMIYTYRIFAAYKTDNKHIMERFGSGKTEENRKAYLDSILKNRSMGVQIDQSVEVDSNSKILTLSTHVEGDDQSRFLVQACLEEKKKSE